MTELTQEQLTPDRTTATELRTIMQGLNNRFPMWAMSTTAKNITSRSHRMARDSCVLYPNCSPRGDDPSGLPWHNERHRRQGLLGRMLD